MARDVWREYISVSILQVVDLFAGTGRIPVWFVVPFLSLRDNSTLADVYSRCAFSLGGQENLMKNTTETLGARIKAQRIRCGMTQEELAEVMCIPKSTISAYENDKVDIKSSVIVELAKMLETDANYLLGIEVPEEDAFINEAMELLKQIKDEKVKHLLLKQIAVGIEE